jgi:glycosyltransferase involved in cell wall biosynthesis
MSDCKGEILIIMRKIESIHDLNIAILTCEDFSKPGGAQRLIIDQARALGATIICPTYAPEAVAVYDSGDDVPFISLGTILPSEPMRQLAGRRLFQKQSFSYDFYVFNDDMASRYPVKTKPHLYYFNTPRRALYDMYYPFLDSLSPVKRVPYAAALSCARFFDQRYIQNHIRHISCISHNTRNRLQKYYGRFARVIYPPLHLEKYRNEPSSGYWLSAGRVDKWKRVELQIEAFRQLPDKKLLIAGPVYPGYEYLLKSAPPNVTFLGSCTDEKLMDLYAACEGFITTAIDEDFGITPVEAMACGKPVVAVKEGGYLETVVDGYTGLLTHPSVEDLAAAVRAVSADPEKYKVACLLHSKRFSYEIFCQEMQQCVLDIANSYT